MGGLRARLLRHLSGTKKMRWHIDYFLGYSGFCVKKYSTQRHRVRRDRRIFLIKNSLLRVLRASAVQSPSPASQESLKNHFLSDEQVSVKRIFLYPAAPGQECRQNQKIASIRGAQSALRKFGASDCNSGCRSHLIFFPRGSRPRIKGIELRLR
jgi:Uri superfamily endonuclease